MSAKACAFRLKQQLTGTSTKTRLTFQTPRPHILRVRHKVDDEEEVHNLLGNNFALPAWVQAALEAGKHMPQIGQDEDDQDIHGVLGPAA